MNLLEGIRESIINGRSRETENRIMDALSEGMESKRILEDAVIPAMKEVGANNEINQDIPRILSAARCVRKGLDILEPHLHEGEGVHYIGTVILGTVEGDLHDVGKNLVAIMYRSVGLQVIDLGVDVSGKQFLKAIKEHPEAKLISLSSLLTTSLPEMEKVVAAIRKYDKKNKLKIMVGGGAVTAELAKRTGADAFSENAVDAAQIARNLILNSEE